MVDKFNGALITKMTAFTNLTKAAPVGIQHAVQQRNVKQDCSQQYRGNAKYIYKNLFFAG